MATVNITIGTGGEAHFRPQGLAHRVAITCGPCRTIEQPRSRTRRRDKGGLEAAVPLSKASGVRQLALAGFRPSSSSRPRDPHSRPVIDDQRRGAKRPLMRWLADDAPDALSMRGVRSREPIVQLPGSVGPRRRQGPRTPLELANGRGRRRWRPTLAALEANLCQTAARLPNEVSRDRVAPKLRQRLRGPGLKQINELRVQGRSVHRRWQGGAGWPLPTASTLVSDHSAHSCSLATAPRGAPNGAHRAHSSQRVRRL